jgi:hypothetical protein
MKVASASPAMNLERNDLLSPTSSNRESLAQRRIQSVFSAVLEQAGRDGYASADSVAVDQPLASEVGSSWDDWFLQFAPKRYEFVASDGSPSVRKDKTADDLRADFKAILVDAYQSGGFATPKAYLQARSADELRTIQQVQHLAEPIHPHNLSDEASLNLLLPPDAQVDLNRDGLTSVGAAHTIRFPDSNTPAHVRDAWDIAVAELPEQDRMLYQLQMTFPIFLANMHFDSQGQFVRSSDPGDADWVNPMASPDFSYSQSASDWLSYLDRFKHQLPIEQYQRDHQFWTKFREQLAIER